MTSDASQQSVRLPRFWQFVAIACLVIGILLRFVNLDGKVYQFDETFTSLRISGYTELQAIETLTRSGVVDVAQVQRYQIPTAETSIADTVKGLMVEEPQLTPLYFVLARIWTTILGYSITHVRLLGAVLSLLIFPALWWFCQELFAATAVSWMAIALVAVSPIQLVYAQEARPPGLWAITTLVCSAALLRALRLKTVNSWVLYGITLVTSFYTFLFTGFVAIAHLFYVALTEKVEYKRIFTKTTRHFAITLLMSVLLFVPWLWQIVSQLTLVRTVLQWTERGELSLLNYGLSWLEGLGFGFLDYNRKNLDLTGAAKWAARLTDGVVLLWVASGFYLLCRKTQVKTWGFVVAIAAIPAFSLVIPDLLLGGVRSLASRYMMPSYLMCTVAVAYAVTLPWLEPERFKRIRSSWQGMTLSIVLAGLFSCGAIAPADDWWNKMVNANNPKVATVINQTQQPLVISDTGLGDIVSLSYYLDPKVKLLVRPQCYTCNLHRDLFDQPFLPDIPPGFTDVFFYQQHPSQQWLQQFEQQTKYAVEVLDKGEGKWLWKVRSKVAPSL